MRVSTIGLVPARRGPGDAAVAAGQLTQQQLIAAEYDLGYMYAKGDGVPQSHVEAVKWYRKRLIEGTLALSSGLASFTSAARV